MENNMKNNNKNIYLVFSKTGTWLSRTLNLFSPIKYVHSSISFDESFNEMYSFGRKTPNNPFSGGFVKESLYEGVFKRFKKSECMIFKISVTKDQFDGLKTDVEFFYKHRERYHYNFIGLFGILFNRPIIRKNHFFCSQFVYILLKKHNLVKLDKHPELVTIIDLYDIENKSIIFEGFITDLPYSPQTLYPEAL